MNISPVPSHRRQRKEMSSGSDGSGSRRGKKSTRAWVVEGFKAFGRHIARNQIRVLLIDSFVMTTLFYPALALQIQRSSSSRSQSSSRGPNPHPIRPKENPLSLLSTPLLDSFFPYPEPPFPLIQPSYFWDEMGTQDDSQAMWNVDDLGRRGRRLSQSIRPGLGREQLIAAGVAWTDVKEILTSSRVFRGDGTLDSSGNGTSAALARVIQDRLGRIISSWDSTGVIQCVKQETTGACFENKEEKVPTLVTYFRTPKGDNRIEQLERQWTEAVAEVGKDLGGILLDTKKFGDIDGVSRTLLVKPRSDLKGHQDTGREHQTSKEIPWAIIILYAVLLIYFLVLLSRATNVHSRFGLAFTGVVELACSSIMAFSVMALLGFGDGKKGFNEGEATVPYYILPFVILIVGVENMSAICKAVYSVPVSYSVPDRVGIGLAKVGPSLLFTSLSDIAVLALIIVVVKLAPVRDFCLFAIILIVVHFWMLITFFLTVLSIDCQRLELDDLLRQGTEIPSLKSKSQSMESGNVSPKLRGTSASLTTESSKSTWMAGARKAWKARTARGGSLVLLLSLLTGLYYVNESRNVQTTLNVLGQRVSPTLTSGHAGLGHPFSPKFATSGSPLWETMQVDIDGSAAVHVLPVVRLLLPSKGVAVSPVELVDSLGPIVRPILPRLKPIFYFFKIIVLPQSLTAFLLYLTLLYLLKDADILDAQRNKKYAGERVDQAEDESRRDSLQGNRSMRFAREMKSKVALTMDDDVVSIATAKERNIAIAVTATGKARLFQPSLRDKKKAQGLPTLLHSGASLAAMTDDGMTACVTTRTGRLTFFSLENLAIPTEVVQIGCGENGRARVSALKLVERPTEADKWGLEAKNTHTVALVGFNDGSIRAASPRLRNVTSIVTGETNTNASTRSVSIYPSSGSGDFATVCSSTSVVVKQEQVKEHARSWSTTMTHLEVHPESVITATKVFRVNGLDHLLIGNDKGLVSIWAMRTSACVWSGQLLDIGETSTITRLESFVQPSDHCSQCQRMKSSTCVLIGSTNSRIAAVQFRIQSESSESCSCASPRGFPGSRSADNLLGIPLSNRTPRRTSRAAPISPSPPGRRSPSPTPGARSHGPTPPPRTDSGSLLDSDLEELERNSDLSLDRSRRETSYCTFIKTAQRHWALYRGDFVSIPEQGILAFTRKQAANAEESLDAQWQLVVIDLFSSDFTDLSLLPFEPTRNSLEEEETQSPTPSSSSMPAPKLLSVIRAQRVASLTQSTKLRDLPTINHPMLAFSRALMFSGYESCLTVTGNVIHTRSISPHLHIPENMVNTTTEPTRRMSAFHMAPLAAPTLVTSRR